MILFKIGPRGPPGASHGPPPTHKAYARQDDLQDVAHRTNTCATICIANEQDDLRSRDDCCTWPVTINVSTTICMVNTWDTYANA